ncbi:MAG: TraR/DksA family transcriptional regulator [Pseudobdellovibrionaceae bacterium]|jgi:DnaK suppressor protein
MEVYKAITEECRSKLLKMKQELLHRVRVNQLQFSQAEKSGDEIDQTVSQLEEHSLLISQERMRTQLLEIEFALARIEKGLFGICEETDELIEIERLRALPYTRVSIEGAELREKMSQRYAKFSS